VKPEHGDISTCHHLPEGAATACRCKAHGSPSISAALHTTSRAHDASQHHLQQARDSTTYTHTTPPPIPGNVLTKAKPPRVKDSNEQSPFPTQRPHAGQERHTSVVQSYGLCYFRVTRKQDASQKQWNILLMILLSPVYLHQGPTKLGSTPPQTHSDSNSQNHEVFKLNREERQEQERT